MAGRSARAFTLIETLAVIGVGTCLAAALAAGRVQPEADAPDAPAPLIGELAKARSAARQLKCSTQIRGITQSMIVWSNNNKGQYPLPSALDPENKTVALEGRAKDTTANILSLLIWNGHISPELCVCPDERNGRIASDKTYSYTNPAKAADPEGALWDPGFRADFTGRKRGNVSYAHLQPSDGRLPMWSDTFATTEAVWSDRGPRIAGVESDEGGAYTARLANPKSATLRIHGAPETWEGNVAFNDGHVEFATSPAQSEATYALAEGAGTRRDTHFFDEPDDPKAANIYLGIFTTAGAEPREFKGIWD